MAGDRAVNRLPCIVSRVDRSMASQAWMVCLVLPYLTLFDAAKLAMKN